MTLAELVAESPRRWRYLDLTQALADGNLPSAPSELSGLLLRGLARPRDPYATLEALVAAGEFDTAELVYEDMQDPQGPGSADDDPRIAGIPDLLSAARDTARRQIETKWETLNKRAERAGLALAPVDPLLTAVASSARAVDRLFAIRKLDVENAESGRRKQLTVELSRTAAGGQLSDLPLGVNRALEAGDFDLAQEILRAGPDGSLDVGGPLTVPQVPTGLPWPDSFDEMLDRFGRRARATAEENRFLPDHDDDAAAQLVDAIGALRAAKDLPRAEALALSIAKICDGQAHFPAASSGADTELTFQLTPNDSMLTSLFPSIRRGIPIRVDLSPDDIPAGPPPSRGVTFHPGPPSDANGEPTTLSATDLLLILARPARNAPVRSTRSINLLRALLRRIPPADLLSDGVELAGPLPPRTALAWVFDLLDRAPDQLLLDALLYEIGEHPLALRTALLALTASVDRGARLTLDDWRPLVSGLLPQLRLDVLDSVRAGTTLQATLWLAVQSFSSGGLFSDADVYTSMSAVAGPRGQERLVDAQSIGDALHGLVRLRILRRSDAGFRLPATALTEALMSNPLDLETLAKDLERQAVSLNEAATAVTGPLAVRAMSHRLDNDVLRIGRVLDRALSRGDDEREVLRADLDQVRTEISVMRGGAYAKIYFDSIAPGQVIDVRQVVRQATGQALTTVPRGMAVEADLPSSACLVEIVPALLETCLQDLIQNAAAALSGIEPWPRAMIFVTVRVTGDGAVEPESPPSAPRDAVMIEIRDNGPGFPTEQLPRLQAEIGVDEDVRRLLAGSAEHGRGLPLAAAIVRNFGGDLEICEQEPGAAGGLIRLWLPRHTITPDEPKDA
ncbi:ATP-binding protein [Kribbella qitaiheensis]|uniref:ATP-binding protein n=1 Tax=Kribbella qitaiheensis TaxID=1544730 RepID=UPI0036186F01